MKSFPLTTQQELQQFCYYLIKDLDLEVSDKKTDNLTVTVHCRTLEILERLWKHYNSGHLDEVAEECFHTDETTKTEEEMGEKCGAEVDTISVETSISKGDYLRCKKYLKEISGKLLACNYLLRSRNKSAVYLRINLIIEESKVSARLIKSH